MKKYSLNIDEIIHQIGDSLRVNGIAYYPDPSL